MAIPCSMTEFNLPFTASISSQIESPYYMSAPMFPMEDSSHMDTGRRTYFTSPPSPASSTGSQRVSKAKKGKRVHSCEFPGCNKVSQNWARSLSYDMILRRAWTYQLTRNRSSQERSIVEDMSLAIRRRNITNACMRAAQKHFIALTTFLNIWPDSEYIGGFETWNQPSS